MFSKKTVRVKNVLIGGNNPLVIQSMTNTSTMDANKTIKQIKDLKNAGAEIIRIAVKSMEEAEKVKEIANNVHNIPLVADIHFDHNLAIKSIQSGISKIRINPGNIDNENNIKELIKVAKEYKVPIRVGANSGSINKKYQNMPKHEALAESALEQVKLLEKYEFEDIVLSIKASDVITNYKANCYVSKFIEYPIHIGVTEAGVYDDAIILSSAGISSLLMNNIGDTIRVSITGNPLKEIYAAEKILTMLGFKKGLKIISCPTCGRTEFDIEKTVYELKENFKGMEFKINLTIAVMGCIVNGPGEAKDTDFALVGSKTKVLLYSKGIFIKNLDKNNLFFELNEYLKSKKYL
jgi:(E)-4-hydroxy-3-methylbut-2-enyl-diphosphate synthase